MIQFKAKLDRVLKEFDYKQEALLPCLHIAQEVNGFISEGVVSYLAQALNLPRVEVYGTASFYSMLTLQKQGKHVIQVCVSLPCYLKNSQRVLNVLEKELNIQKGETTKDGKFSLEGVSCLGACDQAPAIMIDDKVYGNLNKKKIKEILSQYK